MWRLIVLIISKLYVCKGCLLCWEKIYGRFNIRRWCTFVQNSGPLTMDSTLHAKTTPYRSYRRCYSRIFWRSPSLCTLKFRFQTNISLNKLNDRILKWQNEILLFSTSVCKPSSSQYTIPTTSINEFFKLLKMLIKYIPLW